MSKKRILIGSCGGLTGVYLAKQFHRFKDVDVCGFDANHESIGKLFCDSFYVLPLANSENFISELITLLNTERIDFYVPTHSKEIIKISEYEQSIRSKTDVSFIVTPYETYLALDDKYNANKNLQEIGIPVPHIYSANEKIINFPLLKKPKVGSGSNGLLKINNLEEFKSACGDRLSFVMDYINGIEFTVDCLFDDKGNLLGYNQRRRNKCIGGAVSVSTNDNSFDILPYIKKIFQRWVIKGCVNFQYILVDNTPYFIDCNLRYASGGLPLSVASGVDVPYALKKMCFNESFSIDEFKSDFVNRTMYRYFEEKFI